MSPDRAGSIRAAVRAAADLTTASEPAAVSRAAQQVLAAAGGVEVDATELVTALGWLLERLPDAWSDRAWWGGEEDPEVEVDHDGRWGPADLHRNLAGALRDHPAAGMAGGRCDLGPALVALATLLAGRTPLWAPGAVPVPDDVRRDVTRVLGWTTSGDPVERLAAALTAPDPRLVRPLADDTDLLVRIAAHGARAGEHRDAAAQVRWELARLADEDRSGTDPEGDAADRAGDGDVRAALRRMYGDEGLAIPELAERLVGVGRLRRIRGWHFATHAHPEAFADYAFDSVVAGLMDAVPDQLSVSHAGHGLNSYGLNLRLALGPVAVMAQVGWGGAFGEAAEDAATWATLVAGVDAITSAIPLGRSDRLQRRRWLVVWSQLRGPSLPELLRWHDGRWQRIDRWDDGDEDRTDGDPRDHAARRAALRARLDGIGAVIGSDLLVHERRWWHDADGAPEGTHGRREITVPTPEEAWVQDMDADDRDDEGESPRWDPSDLVAVIGRDGLVDHVRSAGGDETLVRRHGVWTVDGTDPEGEVMRRLADRERIPVAPWDLPFLDAAAECGMPVDAELLRVLGG